jgi:DNA polymerase III subunit beta
VFAGCELETQNTMPQAPEGSRKLSVPTNILFPALKSVALAMSKDHTRYVLQGVCLERKDGNLRLIGTDGRRLHLVEIENAEIHAESNFSIIIPSDAVKSVLALPRDKRAPADVAINIWSNQAGSSYVAFTCGAYSVTSNQIDGSFPNYQAVIPHASDAKKRITLPIESFKALIETAAKACTGKADSVKFCFELNTLTLSAGAPENRVTVKMPINYPNSAISIAFDPRYIIGACDAFADESEFTIEYQDEFAPIRIVKNNRLAVVMPMRLS